MFILLTGETFDGDIVWNRGNVNPDVKLKHAVVNSLRETKDKVLRQQATSTMSSSDKSDDAVSVRPDTLPSDASDVAADTPWGRYSPTRLRELADKIEEL